MNSCVLMAQIIRQPQLRYTNDKLEVTDMMVQFAGMRENDPPAILKVVAWGNLAKEIEQNYHEGDQVVMVGRLSMITIDRQEGFKEKRAELTIQYIQALGSGVINTSSLTPKTPSTPVTSPYEPPLPTPTPANDFNNFAAEEFEEPVVSQSAAHNKTNYPVATNDYEDVDDIPFMRLVHSQTSWHELTDLYELGANSYWEGIRQIKP